MASVFIDRDDQGNIIAAYGVKQREGQERQEHDSPEAAAFLAGPPPLTDEERVEAFFQQSLGSVVLFEILFEVFQGVPGPPIDKPGFLNRLKTHIPAAA